RAAFFNLNEILTSLFTFVRSLDHGNFFRHIQSDSIIFTVMPAMNLPLIFGRQDSHIILAFYESVPEHARCPDSELSGHFQECMEVSEVDCCFPVMLDNRDKLVIWYNMLHSCFLLSMTKPGALTPGLLFCSFS